MARDERRAYESAARMAEAEMVMMRLLPVLAAVATRVSVLRVGRVGGRRDGVGKCACYRSCAAYSSSDLGHAGSDAFLGSVGAADAIVSRRGSSGSRGTKTHWPRVRTVHERQVAAEHLEEHECAETEEAECEGDADAEPCLGACRKPGFAAAGADSDCAVLDGLVGCCAQNVDAVCYSVGGGHFDVDLACAGC